MKPKFNDSKPVIGLSVNVAEETSRLHEAYIRAVLDAGGIPVLIPATTDADALRTIVERIDGLILTGGGDVSGRYFGEETLPGIETDPFRDAYDFLLLRLAADRQLPVLGICRGMQVMAIASGGTLWQDIPSQYPGNPLDHSILTPRKKPVHPVILTEDSTLSKIFGRMEIAVNSRHHQAVRDVGEGFRVTGTAPDGIIEAIEAHGMLGVQWHPENMPEMQPIFRFFVAESALFSQAKHLHNSHLTVDSHCDTPMLFADHPIDFTRRDPVAQVDLEKMAEGRMDAAFVVAYIPQGEINAKEKAIALLTEMRRQIEPVKTFAEADRLKSAGKKAIFLGLENGHALEKNIDNIKKFSDLGVVYITLCHNGANDLCDSAAGEPRHGGLSEWGREAVHEMNRQGIAVDLSHAAETTFYDVLRASRAPVICSHSSARALCDHPRNLTDDQLRALAQHGGVAQVCLYQSFLTKDRPATLSDAADHIDHIVRTAGIDHVGIGSDFDGGGGFPGCNGANELINITIELLRRGYTEPELAKIWGGNLRRVINAVQNVNL